MMLEIVNEKDEVVFEFRSELERFTLNEKFCLMEGHCVFFGLDRDSKPLYVRKPRRGGKPIPFSMKVTSVIVTEEGEIPL